MPRHLPLPVAFQRRDAPEFVYLLGAPQLRPVKIGRSIDPAGRAARLDSGCPWPLRVLWRIEGDALLETALHHEFRPYRTHKEWFDLGDADPVALVSATAARLTPALDTTRRLRATAEPRRRTRRRQFGMGLLQQGENE